MSTTRSEATGSPERATTRQRARRSKSGSTIPSPRAGSIRQEAVRLFAERGYAATSMRDIADAVGLLPGSLYAHLESKELLLLDIIETGIDEFLVAMRAIVQGGQEAQQQLRSAIKTHMSLVAENLQQAGVVFHQWKFLSGDDRARVVEKRSAYERMFIQILDGGVASGSFRPELDTRIAVLVILGALNWAPEWFSPYGAGTPAEVGDRVSDLLMQGLVLP